MTDFAVQVLTAPQGKTHLFAVGQAGFIIKSASGEVFGVDLYLSDCVERLEGHIGFKRLLPKILNPSDIQFEVLVATHSHFDHFDFDSMAKFLSNGKTMLFASVECEKLVQQLIIKNDRIFYVRPGEAYKAGDFFIDFINCDHGMGAPDAVGVLVEVDGKRILVAGDTCLHLDRKNEYLSKGTLDVLIAPINGTYGNLNESECAALSAILKPKVTIPCHYGMFASHGGSPGLFCTIMTEKYPKNDFLLMTQGEQYTFSD